MGRIKKLCIAGSLQSLINPGDVIHIDDEAWAVYQTTTSGCGSTIYLMTLRDYMANHKCISEAPWEMTIAEYLDKLCEEYENDCCC